MAAREFEYVTIQLLGLSNSGKTGRFAVTNRKSNDVLGVIVWYGPWRQYAFAPTTEYATVYSPGCLRDIADFLRETTDEHREKARAAQS